MTTKKTATVDPRDPLVQKIQKANEIISATASKGLLPYLNQIRIDSRPEPKYFRDAADSWQWLLAKMLAPAVEFSVGMNPGYTGPRNFAFILPKGSDKTTLIGRCCNWMLAYSRRPSLVGVGASGDRDQAALLLEAMRKEALLNPWLDERLYFSNYVVKGNRTNAKLEVISADAKTSHGKRPDWVVIDEVTWWKDDKNSEELFTSLNGAREKNPNCIIILISNAGLMYSWQWNHIQKAKKSPLWRVYESPPGVHLASWMSESAIAALRDELPPMSAARMLDNFWIDPAESSGFITRREVTECAELGRQMGLTVKYAGDPKKVYLASIDYGAVKDRCVMCVIHQDGDLFVVDRMDVFQGSKAQRVPIASVQSWLNEIRGNFNLAGVVVDPYQMEQFIQENERFLPVVRFEPRGGKSNYHLYQALRSSLVNKKVTWYDGCGTVLVKGKPHTIVDEISELIVRQAGFGYRIDHLSGRHDDRSVCLGMALVEALKKPLKRDVFFGDNWF